MDAGLGVTPLNVWFPRSGCFPKFFNVIIHFFFCGDIGKGQVWNFLCQRFVLAFELLGVFFAARVVNVAGIEKRVEGCANEAKEPQLTINTVG